MASEALGAYMNTATNFLDRLGIEGVGIMELVQPILYKNIPTRCNRNIRLNIFHRLPDILINICPAVGKDNVLGGWILHSNSRHTRWSSCGVNEVPGCKGGEGFEFKSRKVYLFTTNLILYSRNCFTFILPYPLKIYKRA